MKKIYPFAIILVSMLLIQSAAFTQKNYFSIEKGYFYGGPCAGIAEAFKNNGFGDTYNWSLDLSIFPNSGGIYLRGSERYPKTSKDKTGLRIRYGRELTINKNIEINFGRIHNSEVKGLDIISSGKRRINFASKVSILSSSITFTNKKKTAGIGGGPLFAFYKLDISGYTTIDTNNYLYVTEGDYSMNHTYLQPGITAAAFWRFINGKIFFMDLRSDFTMLAPAKTNEISNKDGNLIFSSIKVNRSFFDVTIGAGIKF